MFLRLGLVWFFAVTCLVASAVPWQEEDSYVIAAIGDSVSQATNATGWGNNPEESWSTGSSPSGIVDSHLKRLRRLLQIPVSPFNASVAGSRAVDIAAQVDEVVTQDPDYVILMIGANDACAWDGSDPSRIDKFGEDVASAIDDLVTDNGEVKILLSPIPDLLQLKALGSARGCQWFWNLFGVCPNLLHSRRTQEEVVAFGQRIAEANIRLEDIADQYANNVRFDPNLASHTFSWDQVSHRDCFHPSGEGQDLIAELLWSSGWFSENEPQASKIASE